MGWKEIVLVTGLLLAWFTLNRWVLPWFGISTPCSGSCGVPPGESWTKPADRPGACPLPKVNDSGTKSPVLVPADEPGTQPPAQPLHSAESDIGPSRHLGHEVR